MQNSLAKPDISGRTKAAQRGFRLPSPGLYLAVIATVAATTVKSTKADFPLPEAAIARLGEEGESSRLRGVYRICTSDDGKQIATLSVDQLVRVWDSRSGRLLQTLEPFPDDRVRDFLFSADGKRIVTLASNSGQALAEWDISSGKKLGSLRVGGHLLRRASRPGQYIAINGTETVTASFDGKSPTVRQSILKFREPPTPLTLNQNRQLLLLYVSPPTNRSSHQLILHDQTTSRPKASFTPFERSIIAAAFAPHSSRIAVACRQDPMIHLRDSSNPRLRSEFVGNSRYVQDVAFSPDGRHLVSVGTDGVIRIWETLSNRPIAAMDGHGDRLVSMAFSPDGGIFVTGTSGKEQNSAMVWDWSAILFPPASLDQRDSNLIDMAWQELGNVDPARAYLAVSALLHSGKTADCCAQQLRQLIEVQVSDDIAGLIAGLRSEDYAVRQRSARLLTISKSVTVPQLEQALSAATDLETRIQLRQILDIRTDGKVLPSMDARRWRRMIMALEQAGGDREKSQLQNLLQVDLEPTISLDAKRALDRLESKVAGP